MNTSELTGAALDWAVAKCEGVDTFPHQLPGGFVKYNPSTNWAQGGPIIEREKFTITTRASGWGAVNLSETCGYGPTPLIASMRCYVASKLGDKVEIPEELI